VSSLLQVGGADAVQQHVHLGDGPHRAVEFLAKQVGLAAVFAVLVDVFLGRISMPPEPNSRGRRRCRCFQRGLISRTIMRTTERGV
jgi:hypothetical protein